MFVLIGLFGGVGDLFNGVGIIVGGVFDGVGGIVGDLLGGVGNMVGGIFQLVVGIVLLVLIVFLLGSLKGLVFVDFNVGLVIGIGGLVGLLLQLVGLIVQGLFGGDGYVCNGNLVVSSVNVMQMYLVINVLGILMVNLILVGMLFDGLGNVFIGGVLYLMLIGGVIFDSYIFNINNGKFNGLFGFLLLDGLLVWFNICVNLLVVIVDCWVVNVVQDYQVLVGDGVYVNGFKEVVIGVNV